MLAINHNPNGIDSTIGNAPQITFRCQHLKCNEPAIESSHKIHDQRKPVPRIQVQTMLTVVGTRDFEKAGQNNAFHSPSESPSMQGTAFFDAFARSYDPPHWIIEDLLADGPDPVRGALASAVDAVPVAAISCLDHGTRAQAQIFFVTKDADLQARLYIVSHQIARSINRTRLAEITNQNARTVPLPYDHPALADIAVDAENLVPLSAFKLNGDALCVNNYAFFVLPPVPGSNANYWLLEEFRRERLVGSVRVRLDPLLHGPADELGGRFYRAAVYGRPLDWERIRQLRSPDHGKWVPGRMSLRCLATEYAWLPHDSEVDFVCEELPVADEVNERGSRYLHAVYDKGAHRISHLDGAIRVFTSDDLISRARSHVRHAGKLGTRVKVFRTDRPIEPKVLGGIAQSFFFWNYDVARYFGADVPAGF